MNDKPTVAEVVTKLETLGSPDQIALFFKQEQIVGMPCEAYGCPVANYLERESGQSVSVSQHWLRAGYGDACLDIDLDPHGPISKFVLEFDSGAYPGLFG